VWPDDDEAGDERYETNSEIAVRELLETGYFDRVPNNGQETQAHRPTRRRR
jgi:hypothetical protein